MERRYSIMMVCYQYSLNNTIDAWKMEYVPIGDPPRNAVQSNIIHQLHRQWGAIKQLTTEEVVWKQDYTGEETPMSFYQTYT